VRAKGFDHTTQGAYAAAAGAAKAMGLSAEQTANAIAIAGTANVALRVTRTGNLSHWKGLAYPHVSKEGTFAALLASRGITGPEEVFEGNKGFKDAIAGPFEAALDIRDQDGFRIADIESIALKTFDVAHSIIGGGEEGDKRHIHTKEEADHSLPWMIAVTLLDGELTPRQYDPERIVAEDVQELMTRVRITPDAGFSARFPEQMPADLVVTLRDGTRLYASHDSYEGFHDDPPTWSSTRAKFDSLASPFADEALRDEIAGLVQNLEHESTAALTAALARVSRTRGA
jgi:2-methylcitrate dehydratase